MIEDSDYKFLSEIEGEILEILIDVLVPQNREDGDKIMIAKIIDEELDRNGTDNLRVQELYRRGLWELNNFSRAQYGRTVEDLSRHKLEMLILEIFGMETNNFLYIFIRKALFDASAIYYSYPLNWKEIISAEPAFLGAYFLGRTDKDIDNNFESNINKCIL